MSRHRYVKNLNIAGEHPSFPPKNCVSKTAIQTNSTTMLYPMEQTKKSMTVEQQLQMNDVLEQIRNVIGEEEISGLPDNEIKDTIWYYHFDLQESLQVVLCSTEEQEKRRAAKERQEPNKNLPPFEEHPYAGMHKYSSELSSRSRMPLIHLAQQQQEIMEQQQRQLQWEQQAHQMFQEEPRQVVLEEVDEEDFDDVHGEVESSHRLTTITEYTERTEHSPYFPFMPPKLPSSATNSSYGDLIDAGYLASPEETAPLDPNLIPLSPSGSAIHRLSTYSPAPSMPSSGSRTGSTPPHPPSEPVPPLDTIPDIPDSQSSAVPPPPPPKPAPAVKPVKQQSSPLKQAASLSTPTPPPAKQSKLAQLASSRGSTRTKSSASLGTEASGSIKTYPALRPESHRPISSVPPPPRPASSSSESTATPIPPPKRNDRLRDTIVTSSPSSTSLDVRKALETALELEAIDRDLAASRGARRTPTEKKTPTETEPPSKPGTPSRPSAPTPSKAAPGAANSNSSSPQAARAPSKLALQVAKSPRAKPPPPNHLPPEHTEYLTPIANGSSVTTAITNFVPDVVQSYRPNSIIGYGSPVCGASFYYSVYQGHDDDADESQSEYYQAAFQTSYEAKEGTGKEH
ncbi:hypothetical protein BT96DRAFT_987946 [Gymnopus androsaceus JB14]|uniref:HBS1-like protein N-terminal domain-containing protein n=1 Tax=Gymnopus androsaceus JB14 TaxID=1447944 RepID=A0A6A4I5X9_9AGAR|nr:hypothetical protein BT96DRAFT_987946 [Gymnopus androsaceus JB14]